jgi:acyl dehydratase
MVDEFCDAASLAGAVGRDLGSTPWLEVTQERIQQFADATDDHQWIHVDVERASRGPFGTPVAHGYLTLSLLNHFLPQLLAVPSAKLAISCGCNQVRFPAPVPVGSRIRGSGEIAEATEVPGGIEVVVRVEVQVEGGSKPACVADAVTRFLF